MSKRKAPTPLPKTIDLRKTAKRLDEPDRVALHMAFLEWSSASEKAGRLAAQYEAAAAATENRRLRLEAVMVPMFAAYGIRPNVDKVDSEGGAIERSPTPKKETP